MPYKNNKDRKENYEKNKDEINRKRREYFKTNDKAREKKKEREKKWREENKDRLREYNKKHKTKYEAKVKEKVFEHYGKKCACCGESNLKFLSIDHINGGGTKHRKSIKNEKITVWLYRNNFPKGYQTLCFNCNWGKYINNGICPHKK